MGGRVLHVLVAAAAVVVLAAVGADHAASGSGVSEAQSGGIFRISLAAASGIDYMDPALASTPARLGTPRHDLRTAACRIPTWPRPPGSACSPRSRPVSRRSRATARRTRSRLRTRLSLQRRHARCARARSPARSTACSAPEMRLARASSTSATSSVPATCRDRQGADRFRASSRAATRSSSGSPRPAPDFPEPDGVDATSAPCRRRCRSIPRGRGAFPAAGPYYVTEYRPGRARSCSAAEPRSTAGPAPTTSTASTSISRPRPRRTCCDVSSAARRTGATRSPGVYFDPSLGLVEKYGTNRSQLYVKPGLTLRMLAFNSARPLFRDNPRLRKAVNFALDRRALVLTGGPLVSRASDQYLPPILPGFRDADVYPLERPDLGAREGARTGQPTRGEGRPLRQLEPAPDGARPAREAAARARSGSRSRCAGSRSTARPRRTSASSRTSGRAVGHRARAVDTELHRSVRVHQPALRPAVRRGARTSPASPRPRTTSRCDRRPGSPGRPACAKHVRGARRPSSPGTPRRSRPSTCSTSRPSSLPARVGCIILRPVLDLTAVCLR